MDFFTVSSLMVALANIFTWLENIFFGVLHWLGDFSKAVVSILPNLLSWFGTKAFTSFCWLGNISKNLLNTVNLFFSSLNDYFAIIVLYSFIWLSIVFTIWFFFQRIGAYQKTEHEHQRNQSNRELRNNILKIFSFGLLGLPGR